MGDSGIKLSTECAESDGGNNRLGVTIAGGGKTGRSFSRVQSTLLLVQDVLLPCRRKKPHKRSVCQVVKTSILRQEEWKRFVGSFPYNSASGREVSGGSRRADSAPPSSRLKGPVQTARS